MSYGTYYYWHYSDGHDEPIGTVVDRVECTDVDAVGGGPSNGSGTPRGPGGPGRGQRDVGKEAVKKCRGAIISTTLSLIADITLVVPAIKAYTLFAQSGRLEVYAMLRSADGARLVARGVGIRSVEIARDARAAAGAIPMGQAAERAAHGRIENDHNWRDVIPIWGTGRAAGRIGPACNPQ